MICLLCFVCKIKHFTELEFLGIFLWRGILHFQNGNSRWPCYGVAPHFLNRALLILNLALTKSEQIELQSDSNLIYTSVNEEVYAILHVWN